MKYGKAKSQNGALVLKRGSAFGTSPLPGKGGGVLFKPKPTKRMPLGSCNYEAWAVPSGQAQAGRGAAVHARSKPQGVALPAPA
jgi:hypothetical protein